MNYNMYLRKDQLDLNNHALLLYSVIMTQKNTNRLNNIFLDLRDNNGNNNIDYTDIIKSILDTKNKAIIDINNAIDIAIDKTKQISTEAKQIATEAKQIATESSQNSTEAKQIATEAKQIAMEAKQIATEAKQIATIISSNQSTQYSELLEKINQVYILATVASETSIEAKQLATDTKQLLTEMSQIIDDTKKIVDILFSNQDRQHTDLLSRIDYLFYSFYRASSANIIEKYGNYPL